MKKTTLLLILLLGFHLFLLLNLSFTAWPEMTSYPYLRNNGYLLYKDMIHPYPPLLTIGLSFVYKIFGYRLEVLKIVTWLIILTNDVFIYLIINKLTKSSNLSLLGVFLYVLIQPFLEGNQLWLDLAIVPFVLMGLYFLLNEKTSKNLFLSGFSFGLAIFIKQTTGVFLILTPIYLISQKTQLKKVSVFLLGPIIIFSTLIIRLVTENALLDFFDWTLINPLMEWSKFPGYVQMSIGKPELFILSLMVLPITFLLIRTKEKIFKYSESLLILVSLIVSALLVYPRFSFFHLQLFIALVTITFCYLLSKHKTNTIVVSAYFLLVVLFISKPSFLTDWRRDTRFWSESELSLASKISENTEDSNKVFLLGLPSNLYVFSEKLPPKRWGDNFGWYYIQPRVEKDMIAGWKNDPPDYLVWQEPFNGEWYDLGVYQPPLLTEWLKENYKEEKEISPNVWIWIKK